MERGSARRLKRNPTAYRTMLAPWAIVRWLSPVQCTVVSRFRTRSDADGHLAIMRRLMPSACLEVVFDLEQS